MVQTLLINKKERKGVLPHDQETHATALSGRRRGGTARAGDGPARAGSGAGAGAKRAAAPGCWRLSDPVFPLHIYEVGGNRREPILGTTLERNPLGGCFADERDARMEILSFIEGYYNIHHKYSSLDYRSPARFEITLNFFN